MHSTGDFSGRMPHTADALLELNFFEADRFERMAPKRERHYEMHTTEIANTVCMDGRVDLKQFTQSLPGVIQHYRNLGARFDLSWPMFQGPLESWRAYAHSRGRDCLFFVTYHFSRGDTHRGCAGFGYDTAKAVAYTRNLKQAFVETFDEREVAPRVFRTIQCGFESDMDALVFHGEDGERLDLAEIPETSEGYLADAFRRLYPHIPERMLEDLLPLARGNIAHIADVRAKGRTPAQAQHCEWILEVGRSNDWLPEINMALVVGPYNEMMMRRGIVTAGNVLLGNIIKKRIPIDDANRIVLLACVPYYEVKGPKPQLAERRAKYLAKIAYRTLQKHTPALLEYMERLTVTIDQNTRRFNILDRR